MSVTVAIFFLIEATTACGPVAPARLDGGAEVVRAILDVEEQTPDPSAPTTAGSSQASADVPSDSKAEVNQPDDNPAAGQCTIVATVIA